jgi:hypothetical protein
MVFMLRKMTANFIRKHPESEVNSFSLSMIGVAEEMDAEQYIG